MSVQVRANRVNRPGHAGARDLGGIRKLLTSCNHIYLGIMLTTTFLLFTVLDGKNQLLLALLKCTGKELSFFRKQLAQEVPKTVFFNQENIPKNSLRRGFSVFTFSFVQSSFSDGREPSFPLLFLL